MQTNFRGRDFIGDLDFSKEEVETVLDVAWDLKRKRALNESHALLRDKTLAMLFFFTSTRTRGSFEAGMRGLRVRGLADKVKEFALKNKPILGICLGAQLLFTKGYEFGESDGLDIIPGKVVRFPLLQDNEKIPQVGWNGVFAPNGRSWENSILGNLPENFSAYFTHSYILEPDVKENVLGLTNYGGKEFCSVVKAGNVYGLQFHPEKSGKVGLEIIRNFKNSI